jgi:hypothetical protein
MRTAEDYMGSTEPIRLAHKVHVRRDGSVLLLPFDQSRGEQRGPGNNAGYDQQTTSEIFCLFTIFQ